MNSDEEPSNPQVSGAQVASDTGSSEPSAGGAAAVETRKGLREPTGVLLFRFKFDARTITAAKECTDP
jgi:hypothetical protein